MSANHRPLFVVGTYSVGKEKAVEAVGRASGGLCYVPKSKAKLVQLAGEWKAGLHTLTFTRPGHHDALAAANVSSHEHPHGQSGALKSDRTGQHAAMLASGSSTSRPAGSASAKGSTSRPAGSTSAASGASGGSNLNISGAPHGNGAE